MSTLRVFVSVGGSLVAIGLAVGLWWSASAEPTDAPLGAARRGRRDAPVRAPRSGNSAPSTDRVLSETPEPGSALGSVLEESWGDQWPEVKARLLDAGADLEAGFELRRWSEVEHEVREKLVLSPESRAGIESSYQDWPVDMTSEWVGDRFDTSQEISEADLVEIMAVAETENRELSTLASAYTEQLGQVLRHEVELARFKRAPYSTGSISKSPQRAFFATSATLSGGWTTKIRLSYEDFPELAWLEEEVLELRGERDSKVRDWLRANRR